MNGANDSVPEITVGELKQRLDQGAPLTLLDVREPFEWEIANLGEYGARLIPLGEFVDAAGGLDPEDEIVVYCHSGGRSAAAVAYLREAGFARVRNLKGGIHAWSVGIDPAIPRY